MAPRRVAVLLGLAAAFAFAAQAVAEPAAAAVGGDVPVAAKEATKSASQATEKAPAAEEKAAPEASQTIEEEEEEGGMGMMTMLLIGVGLVVAPCAFFAVSAAGGDGSGPRRRGNAVLLVGPSNSGKTSMFLTLKDGKVFTGTTTSMKENEAEFVVAKHDDEDAKPLHVVDFPGDPSLSYRLPDFYPIAKTIVFVIDANDKKSIEREAAEMMYKLLTSPQIVEQSPAIIVACNKCDLILASKPALLKKTFETELQKLTITQGQAEDSVQDDAVERDSIPLGMEGENFEFEKHSPCAVEFMKCSVKNGDLKDLVARVRDNMEI